MRNLLLCVTAAASLLGASVAVDGAQAATPTPQLIFGVDRAGDQPTLDKVQFIYLGRRHCWYDGGWRGPGWYWCGYAWRTGYGWGGGYGWRGWAGGHPYGWYRGRPGYERWGG